MPAARRLRFLAPILLISLVAACTEFGAASPAASSGVTLPPDADGERRAGRRDSFARTRCKRDRRAVGRADRRAGADSHRGADGASPTTGPTGETMVVRAYFLMADESGDPKLVPVLRTVPRTAAVVEAALQALVAGPSTKERNADPPLTSAVPSDTEVLGVRIDGDLATVDLSAEFASGGGSTSMFGRLAQVVYTVTQFSEVDRVSFEIDGEPVARSRVRGSCWTSR